MEKNKIIHIGTQIQTIFGLLDDNGNVVKQLPINANLTQLTQEIFQDVLKKLLDKWEEIKITDITKS